MNESVLSRQQGRLQSFWECLSPEEQLCVANGEREIRFSLTPAEPHKPRLLSKSVDSVVEPDVIEHLKTLTTVEEGTAFLSSLRLSRAQYIVLLKTLDLPMSRHDNIMRMEAKLVEGTIGFRLRSSAIIS